MTKDSLNTIYSVIKKNNDRTDWAQKFVNVSHHFVSILNNHSFLTKSDFDLLIKKQDNGIANAGHWGACNDEQYQKICNNWDSIYRIIIAAHNNNDDITPEQYEEIRKIVHDACDKNKIIIVNRILAAFFPNKITATCKEEDFRNLSSFMHEHFQDYRKPTDNWLLDNYYFVNFCKSSFEEDENLPIPVFSWMLLNKIKENSLSNIINQGAPEMSESNENARKLANLLLHTHNLILHGAPGTGKTHLAKEIAKEMGAEWEMVQFHPSYDYTDFVEGLRPVKTDDGNQIGFERKDGVFKAFCGRALKNFLDSNLCVTSCKFGSHMQSI